MSKKQSEKTIELKSIEKMLDKQTNVILSAVDVKISDLERRISKLEIKVDLRFNQLATTLDKFLKHLTDMEDEFTVMKLDINRLKKVIKEKLGVDLS